MNHSEYEQFDQLQHDNEVEITNLDLPDNTGSDLMFLSTRQFLHWQHSLTRKSLRHFSSISIVLLLLLTLWPSIQSNLFSLLLPSSNLFSPFSKQPASVLSQQPPPVHINPAMVFSPQTDGLACLTDVAWSPDSKYIALLGYQNSCWGESYIGGTAGKNTKLLNSSGLVVIHNIRSGENVKQIPLAPAILQAFRAQFPEKQGSANMFYWPILWSHDAQHLAILFTIEFPPPPTDANSLFNGVFLLSKTGQPQVFLQHGDLFSHVEWDLQRGKALHIPSLPAASGYQWNADGSLFPAIRYRHRSNVVLPELSRVGNPVGSYAFTIWQLGVVTLNTQMSSGSAPLNGPVYIWHTNLAAWSPNGRYLFAAVGLTAILDLTGELAPTFQTLTALHLNQFPSIRARDVALQHLLQTLSASSSNSHINTLAWHPNGQFLAAYDADKGNLEVLDCNTGYVIASLRLPAGNSLQPADFSEVLRWSPDGSHLLLFNQQIGKVALWNVHTLS
ncbi:MAG: hypothetical protein NVS4B7_01080 [Ktedonobacteraceae bacterium]